MHYFFYLDHKCLQPLRAATSDECIWFKALAQDMRVYTNNIERFRRVNTTFNILCDTIANTRRTQADIEADCDMAVANFLYAFNECLDHWKTFITREYGAESDYYQKYKELTSLAFDQSDAYKITYALRNFQHVAKVVHRVSASLIDGIRIYANRDKLLNEGSFTGPRKQALIAQPEEIELLPLFNDAKQHLERINVNLTFFPVTSDLVTRAVEAVNFRKDMDAENGVLLLGTLLDSDGNEIVPTPESIILLAENNSQASLSYSTEIPWGICELLCRYQAEFRASQ